MTKRLDPDIKNLRALDRTLRSMTPDARRRDLLYLLAREFGVTQNEIRIGTNNGSWSTPSASDSES